MSNLRQYYDTDFSHVTKLLVGISAPNNVEVNAALMCDFAANLSFLSCYIGRGDLPFDFFIELVRNLRPGNTQLEFSGQIYLPQLKSFPGEMQVDNKKEAFDVRARFFGDPSWISMHSLQFSRRVFIYSETDLSDGEITTLQSEARTNGLEVQFRSKKYADRRSRAEKPLAFISHDSRDKDEVARKIAINLQKMMCPVWYDEFSLKVGSNLRDSIEAGLKTCKKCVLVLSDNFFSNGGWTKKEFDSIFTREVLEEKQLVLPVWYGVTKQTVYDYSPSLLNIKGIGWKELGEEEVCRQLYRAITD